jgi:hypothetical protein
VEGIERVRGMGTFYDKTLSMKMMFGDESENGQMDNLRNFSNKKIREITILSGKFFPIKSLEIFHRKFFHTCFVYLRFRQ